MVLRNVLSYKYTYIKLSYRSNGKAYNTISAVCVSSDTDGDGGAASGCGCGCYCDCGGDGGGASDDDGGDGATAVAGVASADDGESAVVVAGFVAAVAGFVVVVVAYGRDDDYLQCSRMRRSMPPPRRSVLQLCARRMWRPALAPECWPAAADGAGAAGRPAGASKRQFPCALRASDACDDADAVEAVTLPPRWPPGYCCFHYL